jgi:prepilin-type N-terminal cleavage/methylation domain-containing protein
MRRPQAGFTLLEVVIALAILGSSMFILLQTHLNALDARDRQQTKVTMNHLLLHALGVAELSVATGELTGGDEFGDRWEGYSYEFEAQYYGESWPNLYELTIRIETPNENDEDFETTQLVYVSTLR